MRALNIQHEIKVYQQQGLSTARRWHGNVVCLDMDLRNMWYSCTLSNALKVCHGNSLFNTYVR